jgi:hypothetical protein
MEALALGIPVVVSNKYKSDFSTLDLLIDLKEFTNNINKFELNKLNKYLRSLRKQKSIIPSNTKLFSFENYNDQLLNFTSQIFDGKVNIK